MKFTTIKYFNNCLRIILLLTCLSFMSDLNAQTLPKGNIRDSTLKRRDTVLIPQVIAYPSTPNENSIWINREAPYNNYTPEELLRNIFISNSNGASCSEISNVTFTGTGWNGTSWTNADRSLSYFSHGSGLNIEEGLLMTTGGGLNAEGPNQHGELLDGGIHISDTDLLYFHNHEDTAFSQILLSKIIAEKTYPDNTKIVYFEINNMLSDTENTVMERELIKNQNILRFKKIPSQTGVQYLFETNHSFSADSVVFHMNNVLINMKRGDYDNSPIEASETVLPPPIALDMRDDCIDAAPFCTSNKYQFPAATDVASLGKLGCLITTPNHAWYWMQINDPGTLEITITSQYDVDFIAWGPFTDLYDACQNFSTTCPGLADCPNNTSFSANYPYGNIADCSYDPRAFEICNINNAQSGEIYLLLITNYSNMVTNIEFHQTGGDASTNCGIITPPVTNNGPLCEGDSLQFTVTNPVENAIYYWTGPNGWTSMQQDPVIYNVTVADAGTYTLIISINNENGNAVTTDVVINTNPVAIISPVSGTVTCSQPVTLTASGGVTYSWSNGSSVVGNSAELVVTAAETYTVTVTNEGGCSDTASVTINIDTTSYRFIEFDTVCPNLTPYSWRSNQYYTTGVYYDSMTALNGCDSIFVLNLTVNPSYHDTIIAEICLGKEYTDENFNVMPTDTGIIYYSKGFITTLGCDSIKILQLTVNPLYHDTIIAEICLGKDYTDENFNVTPSDTGIMYYSKGFITTLGCDSIKILQLTVHPVYDRTIDTAICLGESYMDENFNVTPTVAGIITDSVNIPTIAGGCDSIIRLHLTVNQSYHDTIVDTVCLGDTYNQHNFNEQPSQSGNFTFVNNETTTLGCDSITTLLLNVNPTYDEYVWGIIYEDEFYKVGNYNYNTPGLHISSLQTVESCDSIVNLYLDIIYYPPAITAFSPFNKDGINDYFMPGFRVQIFNRYGALVYQTNTVEEQELGWDGRNTGGQNVEPGLYFYILYNSSGKPRIKSSVEILKRSY